MAINARVLAELIAQHAWIGEIVDDYTQQLAARWVQAWQQIEAALETNLTRLASDNPTVSAQVRAIRAGKAWQPAADQLIEQARRAGADASAIAAQLAEQAAAHQLDLIAAQLPNVASVGIQLVRADPQAMAWIVNRATQQITARHYFLQAEASEQMKQALIQAVSLGENPRVAAKHMVEAVQGVFNGGLTRAEVIARTEQLDAYRDSATATQLANRDVLAGWQWVATLSSRTCRSCIAMHGSIHDIDEPGPLDHQQGRCSRAPVTKRWSDIDPRLAGVSEPPGMVQPGDGEAWLRKQSPEVQDKILGKRGAEAWRNGQWPASQWSQLRVTDGWRDSFGAAKAPTVSAAVTGSWSSKLTGLSAARTKAEAAMGAIENLHGMPPGVVLKSMTAGEIADKPGTLGFYRRTDPGVIRINTTSTEPGFPSLTTAHEFGHLLDFEYLGGGHYASEMSYAPEWLEWRHSAHLSDTGWKLNELAANGDEWAKYAIRDKELWGRSYAQWVAVRSQDQGLLDDLRKWQDREGGFLGTWSEVDFQPIAKAIDAIIKPFKGAW